MLNKVYKLVIILISLIIIFGGYLVFFFDPDNYKSEILTSNLLKVSIEASETSYWKKYTGDGGLNFGINEFGKSAPYNDIYDHFKLNEENILNKIKEKF